jgi:hypothetical protein
VGSGFDQQADGSWRSSTTSSSTDLCSQFGAGDHTYALQDSSGHVIAEGSFTVEP